MDNLLFNTEFIYHPNTLLSHYLNELAEKVAKFGGQKLLTWKYRSVAIHQVISCIANCVYVMSSGDVQRRTKTTCGLKPDVENKENTMRHPHSKIKPRILTN